MSAARRAIHSISSPRRQGPRIAVLVALVALSNLACGMHVGAWCTGSGTVGSGRMAAEAREASGFSAIDLRGLGQVVVTLGDREALTIEAEDDILPQISTTARDGVLVLQFKDGVVCTNGPVVFRVTAKQLTALTVSGSGEIEASGLAGPRLRTSVTGSGDIRLERLSAEELESRVAGSGSVHASGTATRLTLTNDGSGSFQGRDLLVRDARVTTHGSGIAVVHVSDTLKADVSGSGGVRYLGSPRVESKVTGSGRVQAY
jgi:hypothetical protein